MNPPVKHKKLLYWTLASFGVLAMALCVFLSIYSVRWNYNHVVGSIWRSQVDWPRVEGVSAGSSMDSVYCIVQMSNMTPDTASSNVIVVLYGSPAGSRRVMKKSLHTMELAADTVLYYYVAPRWSSGHPESLGVYHTKGQYDTVALFKCGIYIELVVHARPLLH